MLYLGDVIKNQYVRVRDLICFTITLFIHTAAVFWRPNWLSYQVLFPAGPLKYWPPASQGKIHTFITYARLLGRACESITSKVQDDFSEICDLKGRRCNSLLDRKVFCHLSFWNSS